MSDQNPMLPPHSRAAEEAVLGAILIDPECIRMLTLQSEEFYLARNAWIYRICQDLTRQGKDPDYITVCNALNAEGRLAEAGGEAYLMHLSASCPSSLNVQAYASTVQERAYRRTILQACNELATNAYDLDGNMEASISRAMDLFSKAITIQKGARPISDYLSALYDEIKTAAENPSDILGIPTGFIDWDNRGGLVKKTVLKLAGDPGVGKSLLAAQVLMNAAERKYKGALYQLEMTGLQVVRRAISAETRITTKAMQTGKIPEEGYDLVTKAIERMSQLSVYISDASDMTTTDLRVDCQRLKDLHGLDLIVIDYEGLLNDRGADEIERRNLISKRVKGIAKDIDLAVIAIGDMLKEGIQGRVKGMGAHGGTGRDMHDRDEIATLREDGETQNLYKLTWDKNREGGKGSIPLIRTAGIPMFMSAEAPKPRTYEPPKGNNNGWKHYDPD
jgi:replicative DNA helicase